MGKFDGIIDDVIVNAKAAASVVSKKASDVYDSSKQRIAAAEIRAEINTKLKELGALTYKSIVHSVDLSDKIKEKTAEITELKENLDLINDSISSSGNASYCTKCGGEVPEGSKYCNGCGAKLDESQAKA